MSNVGAHIGSVNGDAAPTDHVRLHPKPLVNARKQPVLNTEVCAPVEKELMQMEERCVCLCLYVCVLVLPLSTSLDLSLPLSTSVRSRTASC